MSERASPERSFFNTRYVYPGFTFLLGLLILNPKLLTLVLESADDGLFSGIIALIGIAPLGFLVGQMWHIILYIIRGLMTKQRDSISYLDETIIFKDENKDEKKYCRFQKNVKLLRIRDFLYHYEFVYETNKKTERMSMYLSRRWDLLNTIGSGCTSYILAVFIGNIMRDSNWFVPMVRTKIWEISFKNYCWFYWMFTIFFIIVSFCGIYMINRDRQEFILAIFRKRNLPNYRINKAFPDAYLRSQENKRDALTGRG